MNGKRKTDWAAIYQTVGLTACCVMLLAAYVAAMCIGR